MARPAPEPAIRSAGDPAAPLERKAIKDLRIEGRVIILKAGQDALWRKARN
ncbi:MAG: hypothetical protein ABIJ86_17060 [Spirochaetota bacterium]